MATIAAKLGGQLGLTSGKGVFYGEYRGFAVSVRDFAGQVLIEIGATFADESQKWTCANEISQMKTCKKLTQTKTTGAGISLVFKGGIGAEKAISAFLEQVWSALASNSAKGAELCPLCGLELSASARSWAKINDETFCAHGSCLEKRVQQAEEENREAAMQKKNVLPGAVGAFLGAIVGVIPWVVVYCLGYFVGWCGFFIGMASSKGYELLGGRPGKLKPWIVLACTLFAFALSFVASLAVYMFIDYFKGGYADYGITVGMVFEIIWMTALTPEFWSEMLYDVVVGFIFAIIGCIGVFSALHKESKGPGARVEFITPRMGVGASN